MFRPHFVAFFSEMLGEELYVCRVTYTASNVHAPYCHLWPVWMYHIFPHYLTNGAIFGKKKYY